MTEAARSAAQTALHLLQRFGLSAAFFGLAWQRLSGLIDPRLWQRVSAVTEHYGALSGRGVAILTPLLPSALVVAFCVLVGLCLLTLRRPTHPPERVSHVLVPVAATFGYLAYGLEGLFPEAMRTTRVLPPLGALPLLVGPALVILAYGLSLVSLAYLRRSFAVYVEVRALVVRGPYRWIRHPMYAAYVLVVVALFLAQPTVAYALLSVLVLGITVVRAHLEERHFRAHVPGYDAYAARTGRFFPRTLRGYRP